LQPRREPIDELKPGTHVVSQGSDMRDGKPEPVIPARNTAIHLRAVPPS
jgi:hypothetical protein